MAKSIVRQWKGIRFRVELNSRQKLARVLLEKLEKQELHFEIAYLN